jgi:hypothetical protein
LSPKPACVKIPLVARYFSFLFIFLLLCGCSSSKKALISGALDAAPVITGSVVNSAAFQKGGTLSLGPFNPGPGAAADNETDQLSLMIIKGIKDTLPDNTTNFTIQTDQQKDPDCILEGHIVDFGRKGHLAHLAVNGEIWLQGTGEKIFLFQTSVIIDVKNQSPKTEAYQIGEAIAHFIGSQNN